MQNRENNISIDFMDVTYATRLCGRTAKECPKYDQTLCDNCIGNPVGYGMGNDYY